MLFDALRKEGIEGEGEDLDDEQVEEEEERENPIRPC